MFNRASGFVCDYAATGKKEEKIILTTDFTDEHGLGFYPQMTQMDADNYLTLITLILIFVVFRDFVVKKERI
jgi:hypothetical protein